MARKPAKTTSYERVARSLCALQEFTPFVERCERALREARLREVRFRVSVSGGEAEARPEFVVTLSGTELTYAPGSQVSLSLDGRAVEMAELNEFARRSFDRVPGFGCKLENLTGGRSSKRSKRLEDLGQTVRQGWDGFAEFAMAEIGERLKDLRAEAEARVSAEIRAALEDPGLGARRREALVSAAHREIGKALSAYRHLGDEVLRDAVAAFVVGSVMEE